jgi:hypothetical protein
VNALDALFLVGKIKPETQTQPSPKGNGIASVVDQIINHLTPELRRNSIA